MFAGLYTSIDSTRPLEADYIVVTYYRPFATGNTQSELATYLNNYVLNERSKYFFKIVIDECY